MYICVCVCVCIHTHIHIVENYLLIPFLSQRSAPVRVRRLSTPATFIYIYIVIYLYI